MRPSSRREFLAASVSAAAAGFAGTDSSAGLFALTLKQASERIRAGKLSPVDLTQACLDRIQTYNPKLGAWITVMRDNAMAQARTLAGEQSAGRLRSPLHGIPIGIKDSIDVAGARTTAASAVYEYRFPGEDAEVVRRLRAAGVVLIGKSNMHEFDAGATSAVSYWGPVRNPYNPERVAGGPSGGSAVAVALGNCFAALGTDTGGGIRVPSAYCGVVGLKPSYGRVSLRGIVPMAWSLDHCGPVARTVEDAAMLLQQIAGYDVLDIDSADRPVPDYAAAIGAPVSPFRLGIPVEFYDHLDDEVSRAVEDALALLDKLTKGSREIALPSLLHAGVGAEIAAAHENLHGVNGGGFEPSTARVFPAAAAETARAVDYIRGWRNLELVRRTVDDEVFGKQKVDLLIAPAARHLPPAIEDELTAAATAGRGGGTGEGGGRGNTSARVPLDLEWNTRPFNAYGLPAITLPCGFSKDGLPIGLQIAGPSFGEIQVLTLAHAYQQATAWHNRRPPLEPDTKVPALSKAASEQTGG
ncbi:MAG: amidase [Bryobacteraceae bacterium]